MEASPTPDDGPNTTPQVERRVVIHHDVGLHARPSVKLTKMAKTFDASIDVSADDGRSWVNAKSIVKVMALKAKQGAVLTFRGEGPDAVQAIDCLVQLVEQDFDDGAG